MAKKRKQTRSAVGSLTPEQMEQFEFQMALQERALQMAQAEMERKQENQARQAQFDAFGKLAEMYTGRAGGLVPSMTVLVAMLRVSVSLLWLSWLRRMVVGRQVFLMLSDS